MEFNFRVLLQTSGEAEYDWGDDPERDELFQQCVEGLEREDGEDPYFMSQEFQGEEDERIRDKLVQIRAESGPHPGDSDEESSSDESGSDSDPEAANDLYQESSDSAATTDTDDLFT